MSFWYSYHFVLAMFFFSVSWDSCLGITMGFKRHIKLTAVDLNPTEGNVFVCLFLNCITWILWQFQRRLNRKDATCLDAPCRTRGVPIPKERLLIQLVLGRGSVRKCFGDPIGTLCGMSWKFKSMPVRHNPSRPPRGVCVSIC